MEVLVISLMNLMSLLLGVISVILVFRRTQRINIPVLNNYLIFLILAVITGFCDWIILNWVLFLAKGISSDTADLIYHIFWDLVGFPAYLFAFFYLVKTMNHMAGAPTRKRYNKLFFTLI